MIVVLEQEEKKLHFMKFPTLHNIITLGIII